MRSHQLQVDVSRGLGYSPTSNFEIFCGSGKSKNSKPLVVHTACQFVKLLKQEKENAAICDASINPYQDKNEEILFPCCVVVGFLYTFGSSRHDFQIFLAHAIKHGIELTTTCGLLLLPFWEKELVYRYIKQGYKLIQNL